jgi:adenine-specific DNA-methyltransferase
MSREITSSDIPAYASTRLIAYIGNKRALLPFLRSVFLELDAEKPILRFIDPFAGSGAVSRLARSLGWVVAANDIEEYSRTVNEAWLGVSAEELPRLFRSEGGLEKVLELLNNMHPERGDREAPCPVEPYIARHYAPRCTAHPDWRRERLFYTRENAVFLDRVRCTIDYFRPSIATSGYPTVVSRERVAERAILLGLLIYEAATHANTSGVFKAYHKGFGGLGEDALGRILSPMTLEMPILWAGIPAEVRREDASAFCLGRAAELCYLDPPYNQHQYGSNYHLLNTIASWDRPPVRDDKAEDGSLLFAAGIPPDWKETRSVFCSKITALDAFRRLLSAIDARTVALSYNTEGLVPPEELFDILSDRADVCLRHIDYIKYRGGRQSALRRSENSEILFVAKRCERLGKPEASTGASATKSELDELKADLRLSRALAGPFDPLRFRGLCNGGEVLSFRSGDVEIELRSYRCLLLENGSVAAHMSLGAAGKIDLARLLESVLLPDNASACAAACALIEGGVRERRMQVLALGWLRKLAHHGYEADFRKLSARIGTIVATGRGNFPRLAEELSSITALFEKRLAEGRRYAAPPS